MKRTTKKLALNRETLVSLDAAVLAGVAGGNAIGTKTAETITRGPVNCPDTRTLTRDKRCLTV